MCAVAAAMLAKRKGYSPALWFALCFVFPLFGIRLLALAPLHERTCPRCAETVKAAAKVCRYCNYEFETGAPALCAEGIEPRV